VHHRDSTGVESIIEAGGTQWMNSGKGIVHSERPTKDLAKKGGQFEIIQFWVNAPASSKFNEPSYQPLTARDTPKVISDDGKVEIGVVSGEFKSSMGPVKGNSRLLTIRINAKAGGKMTLPVPKDFNALIYLLDGELSISGKTVSSKDMVVFALDGDQIEIEANSNTRAILLAGEPINEPVVSYGPFVMNTEKEIMQAIQDYQSGKMGTLKETFDS
jgi:quercetin 2,3-dioxygenase